jgi:tetratricopeptide (TPR) repeat protein
MNNKKLNSKNKDEKKEPMFIFMINRYEQFLNILEEDENENKYEISEATSRIGDLYFLLGDYKKAISFLSKSREIENSYMKHYTQIETDREIVEAYINDGDFLNAKLYFQKILRYEVGRRGKKDPSLIKSFLRYAFILSNLEEFNLSHEYVIRAFQIELEAEEFGFEQSVYDFASIAEGFVNLKKFSETYTCIDYARKLIKDSNENYKSGIAKGLWKFGKIQFDIGNYLEANLSLEKALRIRNRNNHKIDDLFLAYDLVDLGNSYKNIRRLKEAANCLTYSIRVFNKYFPSDHKDIVRTRNSLSEITIDFPYQEIWLLKLIDTQEVYISQYLPTEQDMQFFFSFKENRI